MVEQVDMYQTCETGLLGESARKITVLMFRKSLAQQSCVVVTQTPGPYLTGNILYGTSLVGSVCGREGMSLGGVRILFVSWWRYGLVYC